MKKAIDVHAEVVYPDVNVDTNKGNYEYRISAWV